MRNVDKKYHYLYKTTNLINGKYYYGMHSTNNINDSYLGSGKRLRYSIRKYGKDNFKREIIKMFDSREELVQGEIDLITNDLVQDKLCMNLKPGGDGGLCGMVTVKDKNGNCFNIFKDDPRYLSGEVISVASNRVHVKDKDGNSLSVFRDDLRYLSGELLSASINHVTVKDKNGNILRILIDNSKYLSGELTSIMKDIVLVKDKNGDTLYNIVNFNPFNKNDFEIAHTKEYVDLVYNFNKPGSFLPSSIPWSIELVKSLELTNASLYNAIKNSIINPDNLHFSNTSGFHHARPKAGSGFCTFAGQVISSVKIYRELGKVGCYLDLDGHYGNSIEDCRDYVSDLDKAVPKGFNFNPTGYNQVYAKMLEQFLYGKLEHAILNGKVDYVVWCHGADSHEDDDLGGQVNTKYWKECSVIFWDWVKYMDEQLGRPLPVSFALFGGYRKDSYDSVISLHISDIVTGINTMTDANIEYELNYKPTKNKNYYGRH